MTVNAPINTEQAHLLRLPVTVGDLMPLESPSVMPTPTSAPPTVVFFFIRNTELTSYLQHATHPNIYKTTDVSASNLAAAGTTADLPIITTDLSNKINRK
ncbi:hypothetical protein A0J61_09232 [Choanephora cucurbitarum]|uniref:Uncharacterized protein n=1 Tax=Choanephora cucurbitarum TaxID=101091 RepID=A0A1C7N0P4_9FUNG|nr:hypothetical protein A0J61_09232 [Choanephora cucurbitarum]